MHGNELQNTSFKCLYSDDKSIIESHHPILSYVLTLWLPSVLLTHVRLLWLIDVSVPCKMLAEQCLLHNLVQAARGNQACTPWEDWFEVGALSNVEVVATPKIIVNTISLDNFYKVLYHWIICIWIPACVIRNHSNSQFVDYLHPPPMDVWCPWVGWGGVTSNRCLPRGYG